MDRELPLASDVVAKTKEAYDLMLGFIKDEIIDRILDITSGDNPSLTFKYCTIRKEYIHDISRWLKGRGYGCEEVSGNNVHSDLIITCKGKN